MQAAALPGFTQSRGARASYQTVTKNHYYSQDVVQRLRHFYIQLTDLNMV